MARLVIIARACLKISMAGPYSPAY
jgi:hypothetical protein